jgi:ABC-2 type transport system permease protein
LINQGFDCEEILLEKEIPANINILVIADMRKPLTQDEQIQLDAYIARGGNLVILGETNRQEVMNPLVAQFGVQFMPGILVKYVSEAKIKRMREKEEKDSTLAENNSSAFSSNGRTPGGRNNVNNFSADFIQSRITEKGCSLSYIYDNMYQRRNVVAMPGAVGLEYSTDKGFDVIPVCVSDTADSWNELETTNFIDDTVKINSKIGEIEKSYPTALALTRNVADKEQKILIIGDADCLSNSGISAQRAGVPAANFNLIMGSFFWMSDNEVPIDVRRPTPPDDKISATGAGVKVSKWLLMGAFPLLLLASYLVVWLRRRGR